MPCMSETPEEINARNAAEVVRLNQLLCEACALLGNDRDMSPALKKWWKAHQKRDRERKEREAREEVKKRIKSNPLRQAIWEGLCAATPDVRRGVVTAILGLKTNTWPNDVVSAYLDDNQEKVLDYLAQNLWNVFLPGMGGR